MFNREELKSENADLEADGEELVKLSKSPIVRSCSNSDDEDKEDKEANEDLSLKIVEKAILRSYGTNQGDSVLDNPKNPGEAASVGVIDFCSSPPDSEPLTDLKDKKKKERRKKKKKIGSPGEAVDLPGGGEAAETIIAVESEKLLEMNPVDLSEGGDKVETSKAVESEKLLETNPVEISDNIVLRKLLRGPRYFDPPDGSWGTCYNCGEEGHAALRCTSVKRVKPCFLCGSLEHNAKQCKKGQDCFICKKGGHRAKDCPDKFRGGPESSKICLKCGDSGHDMFSCMNGYYSDDLKEIQCYICKSFGHICCADFIDTEPREASCYRCGQIGHTGLECARSHGVNGSSSLSSCYKCGEGGHFARECANSTKGRGRLVGETIGVVLAGQCYKCGEDGHFARECRNSGRVDGGMTAHGQWTQCYTCGENDHFAYECRNSVKIRKANYELTPDGRFSKQNGDFLGVKSEPNVRGRGCKRKKPQKKGGFTVPSKLKQRGGWVTEDPGVRPRKKVNAAGWGSPATPTSKRNKIAGVHAASSLRKARKIHFGTPASNGSSKVYQHRFSASRFGNSSSDGARRSYDW